MCMYVAGADGMLFPLHKFFNGIESSMEGVLSLLRHLLVSI